MADSAETMKRSTYEYIRSPSGAALVLEDAMEEDCYTLRLVPKKGEDSHKEQKILDAPSFADASTSMSEKNVDEKKKCLESVYCIEANAVFRWLCNCALLYAAIYAVKLPNEGRMQKVAWFNLGLAAFHTFAYALLWPKPQSASCAMPSRFYTSYAVNDMVLNIFAMCSFPVTAVRHGLFVTIVVTFLGLGLCAFSFQHALDLGSINALSFTSDELACAYKAYPAFFPSMSRPSQWWNECSDGHCCAYHAIEEIRCAESVLLHASGIFATIFTMVYLLFNLDRTVVGCILMTITSLLLRGVTLYLTPVAVASPTSGKPSYVYMVSELLSTIATLFSTASIAYTFFSSMNVILYIMSWLLVALLWFQVMGFLSAIQLFSTKYDKRDLQEAYARPQRQQSGYEAIRQHTDDDGASGYKNEDA